MECTLSDSLTHTPWPERTANVLQHMWELILLDGAIPSVPVVYRHPLLQEKSLTVATPWNKLCGNCCHEQTPK